MSVGRARPGKAPTAPAKVRRADRQARALELRVAGRSTPEIAAELGINRTTAWRLVRDALAVRKEEIAERAEELRAIEDARYEQYIASLRPKALEGDYAAHRALLRWHERKAKLLGLDLREDADTGLNITVNAVPPWLREPAVDGEFEEMPQIGAGE